MYNNPYMNMYNPNMNQQSLSERIDTQIAQLNQMKDQIKNNHQQPAINQTFQLAPSNASMRYANTIDEVGKETIYSDTPFFSKDMSVLWVKDLKGNIRTYELNEIVPKDEKDIKIEFLMAQIEELKKGMKENAKPINNDDDESIKNETTSNVSTNRTSTKKSKQSDGNV